MQLLEPTFTEAITPYLPVIGVVVGALVVGAFAVWNRRNGAIESRAPDVNEIWAQSETDRRFRRIFEDAFYGLRGLFRGYVRRVQSGGSTDLTPSEREAFEREINTKESP